MNKKKNVLTAIAVFFLFFALIDGLPYGFFILLRFIVFAVTAYIAYLALMKNREKWIWVFGFLAVLFNPFIKIHFDRDLWVVVDFIVGIFLVSSMFFLKFNDSEVEVNRSR